ncbi:DoxX family membrane protein [Flagellimonas nanhaiensis]|uniref:DoxX family protein n=1 Tax=Flagellimonas nanhaiensis TaxID=2292706 RepID=A0A371JUB5_9FLAO|nr:DoxX family membrane protein [Allomuricauda nanhaiensis]RDY61376.1 DoxX family protein [Allomuricauda nanhaiensis]
MKTRAITDWVLRIIPAAILIQTLYFKFTAAPESVYIFETLGLEPVGRIGIGVAELITAILLLIPKTTWLGSLLGIGILAGAIFSHLTQLGIVVQNDGGTLFILAMVTFFFCFVLAWRNRKRIPILGRILIK